MPKRPKYEKKGGKGPARFRLKDLIKHGRGKGSAKKKKVKHDVKTHVVKGKNGASVRKKHKRGELGVKKAKSKAENKASLLLKRIKNYAALSKSAKMRHDGYDEEESLDMLNELINDKFIGNSTRKELSKAQKGLEKTMLRTEMYDNKGVRGGSGKKGKMSKKSKKKAKRKDLVAMKKRGTRMPKSRFMQGKKSPVKKGQRLNFFK
jgi:hypothetical protein